MTELDEFLKKQELEDSGRMDYILRPEDTLPTEKQCGVLLQRFLDEDDPNQFTLETWIYYDDDQKPTIIFYADTKAYKIFGEQELLGMHHQVLHYHDDDNKEELKEDLKDIYESFYIH